VIQYRLHCTRGADARCARHSSGPTRRRTNLLGVPASACGAGARL
jgi:hypothetical protein